MANVTEEIKKLQEAVYGEEVRGAIVSSILAMNAESTNAESVAVSSVGSCQNSAQAAAQSATDAAAVVTTVQAAAQDAIAAKTAAQASETAANTSAQAAGASQTAAAQSATDAATSYNNVKAIEVNVNKALTDAQTAATDAIAAKQTAQQHATNSATNAATASNAQTAASNSATSAKKSADDAEKWAKQAEGIVGAGTATPTKPGFVAFDNDTIKMNVNDQLYAAGINEHIADTLVHSLNNPDGVHGARIYKDATTQKTQLQGYDETSKAWFNVGADVDIATASTAGIVKPDDSSIKVDTDGTLKVYKETQTATIAAADWIGSAAPYTYEFTSIPSNIDIEVLLSNTATASQVEAAVNAQIAGNGIDNVLRAWGDKPSADIPVVIIKSAR